MGLGLTLRLSGDDRLTCFYLLRPYGCEGREGTAGGGGFRSGAGGLGGATGFPGGTGAAAVALTGGDGVADILSSLPGRLRGGTGAGAFLAGPDSWASRFICSENCISLESIKSRRVLGVLLISCGKGNF